MAERTERPSVWPTPAEALRRIQELGTQLTGAARTISEELASSPAGTLFEPMARLGTGAAELSTMWVAPVRAILEEQQQLIDAIATWANEQRKLADRFSEIAERHRTITEGVLSALSPTLDTLDALAGRKPKASSRTTKKST